MESKKIGGGSVVLDMEPDFDDGAENRTTGELIWMLKSSFRDVDFAKVESILTAREAKLKQNLESMVQVKEWLNEKLKLFLREKTEGENELKKECPELQQLSSQSSLEKHERERKAEKEVEFWRRKYEGLGSRISKIDADMWLLSTAQPNSRVSNENKNVVEPENGFVNANVVEENVDLATVKKDSSGGGNGDTQGPPSRCIVEIIDNDDDSASREVLSRNGRTSKRVATSDCSSQKSAQCRTGMLKRKQASCPVVSENKNSNNDGFADKDVDGNSPTADCKIAKLQKLVHGNDGSSINRCTETAASSRSISVEKFCTPSSQEPAVLRQCQENKGAEHVSQNLREFLLDGLDVCDIDDSSSSSTSSFEDEMDIGYDYSELRGYLDGKNWKSEADMLAAFGKDDEWYLKAVCALYRRQTAVEKSPRSLSSSGFNHLNALRDTTLAEFLIDGDPLGKLKKSVSELLQYDPKGLNECKKIAVDHSKMLFEIYQKKEDPLFW